MEWMQGLELCTAYMSPDVLSKPRGLCRILTCVQYLSHELMLMGLGHAEKLIKGVFL